MKSKVRCFFFLILSGSLLATGCSQTGAFVKKSRFHPRGSTATFDVPIVMNDRVQWWIDHFKKDLHGRFALYLSRSGRYESFMQTLLEEEGVPQDLIYVALIESGFSNHAYSRARASGPWQFIQSTGRIFGLRVNSQVDERRDPEKATRAAARYLKRLYREFGDWYLAMAAYNAGEGKVRKAIAKSGSRDFWRISAPGTRYLKWETQNYVPKFIAAALIAKNPAKYGFHVQYQEPLEYDVATLRGPLDLDVAAELAGSDYGEMKDLNPELKTGVVPHETYHLRIPSGLQEQFQVALAKLSKEERVRIVYHKVRRGESVSKIARRYGVSLETLLSANDLSHKKARHLRTGTSLLIPKQRSSSSRILLAYNDKPRKRTRVNGVEWLIKKDMGEEEETQNTATDVEPVREEVVESETPAPVLDERGVDSAALPEVEEINLGDENPKPKMENSPVIILKPRMAMASAEGPEQRVHVVRSGDNLWKISKRYGVRVHDLQKWNKLANANQLKPGKKIVVAP